MEEQLVSNNLVKILFKKGFSENGLSYSKDRKVFRYSKPITLSLVTKWLREVHGIHIAILPKMLPSNEIKYYIFKGKIKINWTGLYNTYEEALELGIFEALQLIKDETTDNPTN